MKKYVRKFNGIYYRSSNSPSSKRIANDEADFRRSKGQLSRVVKVDKGYVTVWSYKKPNKNASSKIKRNFRESQKKIKNLKKR